MKLLFKIEKVTPERMPGAELAAFMAELARFLGSREHVHFTAIRNRSTGIEAHIGVRARHVVRQRLREATGAMPDDVRRYWDEINRMLARRHTSARLMEIKNDGKTVDRAIFPGADARAPELPAIRDRVQVQGILYRIEGKDKTVHAGLDDGEQQYSVIVSREQALSIAPSMFSLVRAEGDAVLTRTPNGSWEVGEITATRIEPISDSPLIVTLEEVRADGGLGWADEPSALGQLEAIRSAG
jgi:hypothetical protein